MGSQRAFDRLLAGVVNFGADGEGRLPVVGVELGLHKRMAQRHRPGRGEVNIFPNPHVFVGRSRIPVHPGQRQIVFARSENFYRQSIAFSGMQKFSSVEFENPEGAGDFGGIGDLLAVDPDIGPVVDAIQMQPRIPAGEI